MRNSKDGKARRLKSMQLIMLIQGKLLSKTYILEDQFCRQTLSSDLYIIRYTKSDDFTWSIESFCFKICLNNFNASREMIALFCDNRESRSISECLSRNECL